MEEAKNAKVETVLVADDDEDVRWLLQRALARKGRKVLAASDGLEALKLAREERPDVAVLDVSMPLLNGTQVCRALRREAELAKMPVLMLSVHAEPDDELKGFGAGADGYLGKPFALAELKARVEVLLRWTREGGQR